ncbi:MAG: SAM-dependent methyltransferase [Halobacteriovoraceae bacterium]|nr:SAM-dependent methyltransferase [Halobacteriovoraceae bacterium]
MKREPELYIITPIHALGLLKEEMQYFYPNWNFNSGVGGFVSYRTEKDYPLEEIHSTQITFSLCKGRLIKKGDRETIESMVEAVQNEYKAHSIHRWDLVEETGTMGDRKTRGNVIDIIRFEQNTYAIGVRFQIRGDFAPYTGTSPIPLAPNAPSEAYLKVGEAFKHFRPLVGHDEVFLDVGCSPGGSTYYLLSKGFRVIGVDPTPLDKTVYQDFSEGFLQLNQPFSKLKAKSLKGFPPVNWILFDVEISPLEVLPQILKLMNKLEECVGLLMMVKCDGEFSPAKMGELEEVIKEFGFSDYRKSILPSLEKEFCLCVTRVE